MRVEQIHIGTREEIEKLVTENHTEIAGVTLKAQLDQFDTPERFGFGLIFMKKNLGGGGFAIDKWWVKIQSQDVPLPPLNVGICHD
jgi:hypothetical protein